MNFDVENSKIVEKKLLSIAKRTEDNKLPISWNEKFGHLKKINFTDWNDISIKPQTYFTDWNDISIKPQTLGTTKSMLGILNNTFMTNE